MKKWLVLLFFPASLWAQTFHLSTVSPSVNPIPFPPINRSCCGIDWAYLEGTRGSYTWSGLDSYITQTAGQTSANMFTFRNVPGFANGTSNRYAEPTDIFTSALCQNVLSTTTTTDCQFKEFVTALMQHVCGVSVQPGSPLVGACSVKLFEMWNEFNANIYWIASYSDLATMSNDAAKIIRIYCGDCKIIGGSTSAGGDGSNPAGGSPRYDLSLLAYLTAWGAIASPSLPDYVSFHTYPSRTNVQPAPFPTSIISNSDPACATSTPSASCRAAIKDQVSTIKSAAVLCNAAITAWACGLPVWVTEGGYGINAEIVDAENGSISGSGSVATFTSTNNLPASWATGMQVSIQNATLAGLNVTSVTITKTGANTFTYADATAGTSAIGTAININLTNTWFLREAYTAQWMLTLAAQAPAQVMWYAYTEQCWGTMQGTNTSSAACPSDPLIPVGYTANHVAFVQAQTWLASSTSIGTLTATPVGPETIWTLNVTYLGRPAQYAWYTGWLTSTTYSTSFAQQQSLAGVITSTGGSVTLTQQPILLTSGSRCWSTGLTTVLCA